MLTIRPFCISGFSMAFKFLMVYVYYLFRNKWRRSNNILYIQTKKLHFVEEARSPESSFSHSFWSTHPSFLNLLFRSGQRQLILRCLTSVPRLHTIHNDAGIIYIHYKGKLRNGMSKNW